MSGQLSIGLPQIYFINTNVCVLFHIVYVVHCAWQKCGHRLELDIDGYRKSAKQIVFA